MACTIKNLSNILAILLLSSSFFQSVSGCVTTASARRKALPGAVYIVVPGDTVSRIAHRYRVDEAELRETNGVSPYTSLRAGQVLFIPDPAGSFSRQSGRPHHTKTNPESILAPRRLNTPSSQAIFAWPIDAGVVFRKYDSRPSSLYEGIGIAAPLHTPVKAAANGQVIYASDSNTRFGRIVMIRHQEPWISIYAHLDHISVRQGQAVHMHEVIGTVGQSGEAESPCVHFQLRADREPVDPLRYMIPKS